MHYSKRKRKFHLFVDDVAVNYANRRTSCERVRSRNFWLHAFDRDSVRSLAGEMRAGNLHKTLSVISQSILRTFYKPCVQHYVETYSTADGVDGPASVVSPTQCNPEFAFRKSRTGADRSIVCRRILDRDGMGRSRNQFLSSDVFVEDGCRCQIGGIVLHP